MITEKRRQPRFAAKDGVYAALGSQYDQVGRIHDVSLGGLSFKYFEDPESKTGHEQEKGDLDFSQIAIFGSGSGFYLPNLACRVVCRRAVSSPYQADGFGASFQMSRCSVEFGKLTRDQKSALLQFLENHTDGSVP
jgi:hypothetical protein